MASSTFKFMLGLVPGTEALETKNQALLNEYNKLKEFLQSEKLVRFNHLSQFVSSKEFAEKKNYYLTLNYKGSDEEKKESHYLSQKKSQEVRFFYKFKTSADYAGFQKMNASESISQHEKLKAFIASDAFKKVEEYMKDKKKFEKTQEFQKSLEYKSLNENPSFKNYFKFISNKGYNDFKNLYKSTRIAEFEALTKYVQSNEFASQKAGMKPAEFKSSEANTKFLEYEKLRKSSEIKNYTTLLNSTLLADYKKIHGSDELTFYTELKDFVTSPAYATKKKEVEALRFENTEEYKKLHEFKKLAADKEVKIYYKVKESKELAEFQKIESSKLIPEYEALEKQIQSPEFKDRKVYLLDKKKWEKSDEFKQFAELEALKKDPQVVWYLKIKDSKKFDGLKAWNLVFEDDFTAGKIDRNKWITRYFWGEVLLNDTYALPGEKHLFTEEKNIQCNGSSAKIITKKEKIQGKEWNPMMGFYTRDFDFSSAIINSGSSFRTQYGKIEAKIKINPAKGTLHAFWLAGETMVPQIDIFKCVEDKLHLSTFWGDPLQENSIQKDTSAVSASIVKGKYMIYTMEWAPESITWKINNEIIKVQSNNIPKSEMYLAMNSGVFSDDADVSNTGLEVDWIRCYHKS